MRTRRFGMLLIGSLIFLLISGQKVPTVKQDTATVKLDSVAVDSAYRVFKQEQLIMKQQRVQEKINKLLEEKID